MMVKNTSEHIKDHIFDDPVSQRSWLRIPFRPDLFIYLFIYPFIYLLFYLFIYFFIFFFQALISQLLKTKFDSKSSNFTF